MSVLALIPARSGSKGIPGKNLRKLGGKSLIALAVECAQAIGCWILVSSDIEERPPYKAVPQSALMWMRRPADLAQDDTPMFDVVQHALSCIPGSSEDICVLLQPTQPFRTPAHVQQAIALLRDTEADSVVSVTPLPLSHSPDSVLAMYGGRLVPFQVCAYCPELFSEQPTRRQDATQAYRRDGTVYCFWRKTLDTGTIYGHDCRPLIIPPEETCELDTEADWIAVERRWKEQHG